MKRQYFLAIFLILIFFISKGNQTKYKKVYEPIDTFVLNLNFNNIMDTIIVEKMHYVNIETNKKAQDPGDFHKLIFAIDSKRIVKVNDDGWVFNTYSLKQGDSLFNIQTNIFFTLKLSESLTGLVFVSYPYASDPDKYTIFTVGENSEIKTVYDKYFDIVAFEDINSDGIKEIIGPIGYYGEINPDKTFVPYRVYLFKDTFELNENLSYEYNLKFKNYRDYPEATIRILNEEELKKISKKELRIMRNEIFADYGYIFKSEDLRTYFNSKDWYKPRIEYVEKVNTYLTEYERKNIALIRKFESK